MVSWPEELVTRCPRTGPMIKIGRYWTQNGEMSSARVNSLLAMSFPIFRESHLLRLQGEDAILEQAPHFFLCPHVNSRCLEPMPLFCLLRFDSGERNAGIAELTVA